MSETSSEASHRASGATECMVTVQLLFAVRGMPMMSNRTPRHNGCRSNAAATRACNSRIVAGVFSLNGSKSMARTPETDADAAIVSAGVVNEALRPEPVSRTRCGILYAASQSRDLYEL